jgi:hypothetical protein
LTPAGANEDRISTGQPRNAKEDVMAKEKRKSASQAGVGSRKQLARSLSKGAPKPATTGAKRKKAGRTSATALGKARR